MKRGIGLLFAFVLVLQTIFTSLGLGSIVTAQGNEQSIFKNFAVVDEDGNEVSEEPFPESVQLKLDWSVKGMDVQGGYSESLHIAPRIKIENNQQDGLYIDEVEVGEYQVTTDGEIVVTFTEEIENYQDAEGTITIDGVVEEVSDSNTAETVEEEGTGTEGKEPQEDSAKEDEEQAEVVGTEEDKNSTKSLQRAATLAGEEITENIITGVKLSQKIGEEEFVELDAGKEIIVDNPYDEFKVKLDYEFALPDGHKYGNGSTFTIDIPDVFSVLANPEPQPLKNAQGVEFATFIVTSDNKIVITFNENIEENSSISGYINLESEFSAHYAGNAETEITFPLEGDGSVTYPIKFIPKGSSIDKKGVPNKAYNTEMIEWTVDFNKDLQEITNATLNDVTEGKHSIIEGSFKVYKLHMNADGTIDESKTEQLDDNKFGSKFPLQLGDIDSAYRIVYETEINDDKGTSYENTAILDGDNISELPATASVGVERGEPLEKRSIKYDPVTQTITWEVKYNYDEKTISQDKAKLTDIFGKNQELVVDSFEVYEIAIDPDTGKEIEGEQKEINADAYTLTKINATEDENAGFEFHFKDGIEKAYKIIYQTTAIDRVDKNETITNNISDEFNNSKSGNRWISQGIFVKTHDNAKTNYDKKQTGWTLQLNTDRYTMENVVVTDTLPKGFTLDEGSLRITHGGVEMAQDKDYTLTTSEVDGKEEFAISFKNSVTEQVSITFLTNINFDKTEPEEHGEFVNNALLEWIPEGESDKQEKKGSAQFTPDDYTKANGFKGASYNAATKTIDWEIGVNYNNATLDNAIVEDYIIGDQNFTITSVKVYEMDLTGGENGVKVGDELTIGDPNNPNEYAIEEIKNDKDEAGFKITLGNIKTPYKIVYQTDLNDKLVKKTYDNTATLNSDNRDPIELKASVSPYHGGEYTKKTANQNDENPRIVNWRVNINYAQSTVSNVSISDTPSANQLLLPDTIKLYGTTVSENPNQINKDRSEEGLLVEGKDYTLVIVENEDGTETFTVTFTEKTIDRAYVLEYDTRIMYKDNGFIENDVKFIGEQTEGIPTDNKVRQQIQLSNIGGGIEGEVGSLEVTKVDADDQKLLEGATFELYEKDSGDFVRSYTTGEDGIVIFKNLLYGEYILKETEAPEGYVAGIKDEQIVTVNADVSKVTIENNKFVGDVELTKIDSDTKEALEGVVFELQDKDGHTLQEDLTTDASGKIIVEGLEPGDYYFKEVQALHGYELLVDEIPFTIKADQIKVLELGPVENDIILGSVELSKVDADNNNAALEGVEFKLEDAEGNIVKENLTTNSEGKIKVDQLRPGTYYFIETNALEHYKINKDPIEVVVEKAQTETAKVQVENSLITGAVELTKKGEDGNLLEGVVFELQDDNGEKISEHTTDANGKITVDNLKPGFYQFVETKSIDGYEINPKIEKFEIINSQENAVSIEFTNELTPGSVELTKLGEENEVLEGAEFKLVDDKDNVIDEGLTTDANGKIVVENLKPGTYYFVETKAPFGHELDDIPVEVEIEFNQQTQIGITKVNERSTSGVELTKKGEDGHLLEGVIFELQDEDGNTLQEGLTTDENGVLTVDHLKPGNYRFVETEAIDGYVLNTEVLLFSIELGQKEYTEVEFTNDLKTGSVELTKLGEEEEALDGAEFTLLDEEENEVQTGLTTNSEGKIIVSDLKPGKYSFVETKAPFGHDLDATPVTFDIEFNQKEIIGVKKENERTTSGVVLTKKGEDGKLLEGVVFELQDAEGNVIKEDLQTDANGKLTVENLKPGIYKFKETASIEGYDLNLEVKVFEITLGQTEKTEVEFTNNLTTGSVELTKIGEEDEVLKDAEFMLLDEQGNELQTSLLTNDKGKIVISDLKPGTYSFVETKAPFGHELDEEALTFEVEFNQQETLKITKENKRTTSSVELTKVDDETGETLADAVFELKDKEGTTILEGLTTDEKGIIFVDDLKPGTYQFVETKAPEGYKIDQEPIVFTIELGQTETLKISTDNSIIKGDFELTKVDFDQTDLPLAGVEFELQDQDGKKVYEKLKTDKKGNLLIKDLRPGQYILVETKALFGYEKHLPITFTIDQGQLEAKKIEITNMLTRGTVELTKVDQDDEKAVLVGAEFELQDSQGNTLYEKVTTDKNGQITIDNLKPGKYQFVETKAPKGYELEAKAITFEIVKDQQEAVALIVTNKKVPVSIDPGKDPEQPSSEPKDKDDSVEVSGKTDSKNGDLPKTATNTFNMIVVGLAILIIGFSIYWYRRKTA
ncbi:SpaA isopeptide-forming pilin-related protein [Pseudogracilibacillus auburnensis]|uniref:SpaA isopeptide-forming pilin-related protein n=1 Tax=Pseudogracilibacillus auburnensis TaxID=1494959 RepID=UPI001A96C6F2|nr:SpaA isopeptide-forming pilin-related protein [Pseudogracilibacillus auburnensis]MBO1004136.1 LPXTG cell wall anchor domain-containing protein [Pseudogracilibacillus auburnensis]